MHKTLPAATPVSHHPTHPTPDQCVTCWSMHGQASWLVDNSKVVMKPSLPSNPVSQGVVHKNWPQQINYLQTKFNINSYQHCSQNRVGQHDDSYSIDEEICKLVAGSRQNCGRLSVHPTWRDRNPNCASVQSSSKFMIFNTLTLKTFPFQHFQ